jgi:hypothetical protein
MKILQVAIHITDYKYVPSMLHCIRSLFLCFVFKQQIRIKHYYENVAKIKQFFSVTYVSVNYALGWNYSEINSNNNNLHYLIQILNCKLENERLYCRLQIQDLL